MFELASSKNHQTSRSGLGKSVVQCETEAEGSYIESGCIGIIYIQCKQW